MNYPIYINILIRPEIKKINPYNKNAIVEFIKPLISIIKENWFELKFSTSTRMDGCGLHQNWQITTN